MKRGGWKCLWRVDFFFISNKRASTFIREMRVGTGGPRLARFQLARSLVYHDLKIVLKSVIPRFSTIFQKILPDLV